MTLAPPAAYTPGDTVYHPSFGQGEVLGPSPGGKGVAVRFATAGERNIVADRLFPSADAAERSISIAKRVRDIPRAALELITASSFAARPTPVREFLDQRCLIPMRNVTILSGDGGTGKSLLAMQLAAARAGGAAWLGKAVRPGPALYFSAEDDAAETHIRLAEICAADGIDLASLHDLRIAVMAGKDAVLGIEQVRTASLQPTPLWRAVVEHASRHRGCLVVFDNLADVFAGNENARHLARQFVGMLRGLAIEHDCAVLLLMHPSLSGMSSGTGTSGNTAWSNSVRSRLYLRRDVDPDGTEDDQAIRILETKKANYGPTGEQIKLRWEQGRFVAIDDGRTNNSDPIAAATKAERVFLYLLRWHLKHSKFVSPNRSRSWAPAMFASHPKAEGVKARQFETAMNVLLDQGRIEIFTHGSMSHRRQHIGLPLGRDLDEDGDDE